ncbi:MAG TPA: hypothetical protein VLW45_06680 [Pelomicrobium sp.]|nr:hypothetical protein [Pelomicrobium sp.]
MFEYSYADLQAQVAGLPAGYGLWFRWMFVVIVLAPFAFLKTPQGRVAAALSVVFLLVQIPLAFAVGVTHLLSLPHLLIWGPLFLYLARELHHRRIRPASILGVWSLAALATLAVTLVFDVRNFGWWLAGNHGVLDPSAHPGIPWPSIAAMLLVAALVGWYVFGGELPRRAEHRG